MMLFWILAALLLFLMVQSTPSLSHRWEPLVELFDVTKTRTYGGIAASSLLGDQQKLYVSITTISSRLPLITRTIRSIFDGMVIPTHVYLFLSEEPFLFDNGIRRDAIPLELQYLTASTEIFSIIYTDNVGPHRKLLPILKHFWDEDCVIVTFDDDKVVAKDALFKLISYYIDYRQQAVVGLRVRRIGFCTTSTQNENKDSPLRGQSTSHTTRKITLSSASSWQTVKYGFCHWPRVQNERLEMLVLPTGNGGVLYRPRFFHEVVFDPVLRQLTAYNDDLTFRLATLVNRIPVVNGCCERLDPCMNATNGATNSSLYDHYATASPLSISLSEVPASDAPEAIMATLAAYMKYRNETSPMDTNLYIHNEYLNTHMWRAGIAYLQRKGLLDMDEFVRQSFMAKERPECFHQRKAKMGDAHQQYILKERRRCGLVRSCT